MFRSALSKVVILALIAVVVVGASIILLVGPFGIASPFSNQGSSSTGPNAAGNQPPLLTTSQPSSANGGEPHPKALFGSWNLTSSALYYDSGGGGGASPIPANTLQLNSDGTWSYGTSQAGTWTVDNITSVDWSNWVLSPQNSMTQKLNLNNWEINGTYGTINGPIQYSPTTPGKIDTLWVVVPVDPPLTKYPGEVYLKFNHPNTNG